MRMDRTTMRQRFGGGTQGRTQQAIDFLVRRLRVVTTAGARWVLEGFSDWLDNNEEEHAEVFGGLYVYARPGGSDNAEAVVVKVGAQSGHPVVIALRNHDAIRAYIDKYGDIEAGEMVITNSGGAARIILKTDGSIHAEDTSGGAVALALKSDVDHIKELYDDHTHTVTGIETGVSAVDSAGPDGALDPMVGTTKFFAE